MSINLQIPDIAELKPRITVFGVGGAGGNAVNNMIESRLEGVEFVVANTDAQALSQSSAERRVQMGATLTEGLGAGSKPQIGAAAAEEAMPEIMDHLNGSHMSFITAGMGGGTGTGAAPVIARASRELGILTIGVVTKPFHFEGARRMALAEQGIADLAHHVDTLIVIPNQNLFRVANEHTTFADAFAMADQVLYAGVAGITDLMVKDGLINLDFADVRTIMNEMGKAMMGTGEATGDKRAVDAAEAAISNPLLDDVSMRGARGLLISITGGKDLTLYEVDEAASRIREEVDPDANIILGATFDEALEGTMRVSVVATGIDFAVNEEVDEDTVPAFDNAGYDTHALPLNESGHAEIAADDMAPGDEGDYPQAGNDDAYQSGPYSGGFDGDDLEYQQEAAADETAGAPDHAPRPPRMPSVEDFPPVAQREIAAGKAAQQDHGIVAEKRKSGFFERLASVGLGRKEPPAQPAGTAPAQAPAHIEPQGPSFAAADPHHDQPETAGHDENRHSFLQSVPEGQIDEEDDLEIPAFLRRQAN